MTSSSENLPAPRAEGSELDVAMNPATASIPFTNSGLQPRDFSDVVRICKAFSDSGLFFVKTKETGWKPVPLTWQQCFVRVHHGAEIGLSMMQSMWNIYDVYGRPHVQVETAWGLVLRSGELEDSGEEWINSENEDERGCMFWAKPKGRRRIERVFTIGEAKDAGLVKDDSNWTKYGKRMVYQRAKGFVIKDGFPHVLHGLGVAADDEIAHARNVTPGGPIAARAERQAPAGPDPLLAQLSSGQQRTVDLPTGEQWVAEQAARGALERPAQTIDVGDEGRAEPVSAGGGRNAEPASTASPSASSPSAGEEVGSASPAEGSAPIEIPPALLKAMRKRVGQLGLVPTAQARALEQLTSVVVDCLGEQMREVDIAAQIVGWRP